MGTFLAQPRARVATGLLHDDAPAAKVTTREHPARPDNPTPWPGISSYFAHLGKINSQD
jgi:hypothetical protein